MQIYEYIPILKNSIEIAAKFSFCFKRIWYWAFISSITFWKEAALSFGYYKTLNIVLKLRHWGYNFIYLI